MPSLDTVKMLLPAHKPGLTAHQVADLMPGVNRHALASQLSHWALYREIKRDPNPFKKGGRPAMYRR